MLWRIAGDPLRIEMNNTISHALHKEILNVSNSLRNLEANEKLTFLIKTVSIAYQTCIKTKSVLSIKVMITITVFCKKSFHKKVLSHYK